VLESVGYRVEDAASVSSADVALARVGPDVVLTDWLLPDGNGLDVCRALGRRVLTRHVPVVAVTGMTLGDGAVKAEDCPAMVTVLQKPAEIRTPSWQAFAKPRSSGWNGVCVPRRRGRSGMRRRSAAARDAPRISVPMPRRCCSVPWPAAATVSH